jgi:hypothetical protein
MTDSEKNDNIFKIMDGIIFQLNKTKKMFIIMILTIMIIPPVALLISFAIWSPPFEALEKPEQNGSHHRFIPMRIIPPVISLVWLGIGIRQWFILSKWTKKYERYKELQEKIDKKLDDDDKNEPAQS